MTRFAAAFFGASTLLSTAALAADPVAPQGASPAAIQDMAHTACEKALDNGTFGDYESIEDCTDQTARRMVRAQSKAAKPANYATSN